MWGEGRTVPEKQHLRGHGGETVGECKGRGHTEIQKREAGNKGMKQHSRAGGKRGMLRVTANSSRAELRSMSAGMARSGNVKTQPWDALLLFSVLVQQQVLSLGMM